MALIFGQQVALRSLTPDDAPRLLELYRDNAAYLKPWDPTPPADFYSLAFQRDLIDALLHDQSRDRAYTYGLVQRGSGLLVGRLRFSNVVRGAFQNAYLGYWLAQAVANQGLMTEAVGLALGQAFTTLHLHRVQAATLPHNYGSIRVLTKNGFRQEGRAERYLLIDGRWQDHLIFATTSEEFIAG